MKTQFLPDRRILLMVAFCAAVTITAPFHVRAQSDNGRLQDEISFSNDVRPIISNFCTTCHAGEDPDGDLSLKNYQSVREMTENGNLIERINDKDDPMPPVGLMPPHFRRTIEKWADTGYIKDSKVKERKSKPRMDYRNYKPPTIKPAEVTDSNDAFKLLDKLLGHWVGSMWLMGQDWDWMAFDFRAIDKSHIHGMFEGGSIGNLFTSFFITEFNGKRTIMARNGGILNGIYRVSYFVLDKVERRRNQRGQLGTYYRLVDAVGGPDIMYMELHFTKDSFEFNAFTSRMGLNAPPKPHMRFEGTLLHPELSRKAAARFKFPQNTLDLNLRKGLPIPAWVSKEVPHTSASYVSTEKDKSIEELGKIAKDPYTIEKMPNLSRMTVSVDRNLKINNKPLLIYLSSKPLTHSDGKFISEFGYIKEDAGNSILLFPEITGKTNEFTFTYLHPGDYFLTVVADMDGDSLPGPGDIAAPSQAIAVAPSSHPEVKVKNISTVN